MPEQIVHSEQISELSRLNAAEFLRSFKLPQAGLTARLLCGFARVPAARLALQMVKFDQLVGSRGLKAGADYLLQHFTETVSIDAANVPRHGPLLVVSNHPGMVDAMAIWAALDARRDLLTMARDQRLLRLLPNTCRHLILVTPKAPSAALRTAINHLRSGGALLTFPAGEIEPDPAIRPTTLSDANWSGSIELLMRAVPDLMLLPAAVGGLISRTALRHPFASWFHTDADREWAAATLQILFASYRDTHTRAAFGEVMAARSLAPDQISGAVKAEMNRLIARVGA